MGASGTGGTVVMLLASKEYGEKKKNVLKVCRTIIVYDLMYGVNIEEKKKSSFILTLGRIYRNQLGTRCTAKLLV